MPDLEDILEWICIASIIIGLIARSYTIAAIGLAAFIILVIRESREKYRILNDEEKELVRDWGSRVFITTVLLLAVAYQFIHY